MKNRKITGFLAWVLCLALLFGCLPITAGAQDVRSIEMTEGEVIREFVPAGTVCTSSDPAVAWVDADGTLNALKPGVVTICADGAEDCVVSVEDYSDGTPVVGNLKILARYNDNMQFYDGHVYLLFTSYQDGVEVSVPDLYAGYEISPQYYTDISDDISYGSNHIDANAENYFTFRDDLTSVTLNRGEIVTIGMYRDFDLSVPMAALGSIQNSSLWGGLVKAGKASLIETVFGFLNSGRINAEEALERFKAVIDDAGLDYNKLLDGVVDGGVCFNRELYNQKLEWDQYENVTYEMDITARQLNVMTMYLRGNLNKFSILKNSCATVALRAWNAAVGMSNGEPNAYYLTSQGEGIFSIIDAPKGVRDSIVSRLPGYYLNNAAGVAEPDAGYQDETGWVYVSAPEKIAPLVFRYDEGAVQLNTDMTDTAELFRTAAAGQDIVYHKEEQEIGISLSASAQDDATVISGVDFSVNGTVCTFSEQTIPENGLWFKTKVDNPAEGEDYYVTDPQGNALASFYDEGWVSFRADTLPFSFRIVSSSEGVQNLLRIHIENEDSVNAVTEVYRRDGDEKIVLDDLAQVDSGTKIYIKAKLADDECEHILANITLNWENILDDAHYDAEEDAYVAVMPAFYSQIDVNYMKAVLKAKDSSIIQLPVGVSLDIADAAVLLTDDDMEMDSDLMQWQPIGDTAGILEVEGGVLTALAPGDLILWAGVESNPNIGGFFSIRVYESADGMAKITLNEAADQYTVITAVAEDGEETVIPYSGYLVKKGSVLTITPIPAPGQAVLYLLANDRAVLCGDSVTVEGDTEIRAGFVDAEISGMPKEVRLAAKGDTCQLDAALRYTGVLGFLPVYDGAIRYECGDPIISVDENGMITVVGDVPEEGAAAIVTAFGGTDGFGISANTRVVIGDYQGDRIVGSLTISARRIYEGQLVAHGAITFTTYEDVDLNTSYYHYYRPSDAYNHLMIDYEQNPENYSSDPALYSNNELNIDDRESYFDARYNGDNSDPATVSLVAGESITISNYGYDRSNLTTIMKALQGSLFDMSPEVQELVRQMELYVDGKEYDPVKTFDSMAAAVAQMYRITKATGSNPADGPSVGGMDVNRELYNQFRRDDSQMPNNYYTVEITADELAILKAYMANPDNNYYSLFVKNCSTGAVDIWNTVLADNPELAVKGNLTGFAADPQSLFFELGVLNAKKALNPAQRGKGGTDFYPRTVRYSDAVLEVTALIDAIGEVEYTDACKAKIDAAREAYEALNDVEKARVRNRDDLTADELIYDALKRIAEEEALAADMAAFNAYKEEQVAAVDALAGEDDDLAGQFARSLTKALIAAQRYDDSLTLEENKAIIDALVDVLKEAAKEPDQAQKVLRGDVDGDGKVDVYDAASIQKSLSGVSGYVKYDTLEKDDVLYRIADVDGSGIVDIFDAAMIQKWMAGDASAKELGIGEAL